MSRSRKKHCFASPRREHRPSNHKILKAKKHKVRSLLATRYDDDDLILPGKELAGWNSKAWYESFKTWTESRSLFASCRSYVHYYLRVLRK